MQLRNFTRIWTVTTYTILDTFRKLKRVPGHRFDVNIVHFRLIRLTYFRLRKTTVEDYVKYLQFIYSYYSY